MRELLTDDEVIALLGSGGRSWPLPLLTVSADPAAVTAAAFRGLRSLIVRGLATPLDAGTTTIAPDLLDLAGRVSRAPHLILAHVSGVLRPGLAGAAVTAFQDDGGAVLDVVNATGVHAIESTTDESARDAIERFARTRFAPNDDVHLSPGGCVLVSDSRSEVVARVRPGLVELGTVETGDIGARFVVSASGLDFASVEDLINDRAPRIHAEPSALPQIVKEDRS